MERKNWDDLGAVGNNDPIDPALLVVPITSHYDSEDPGADEWFDNVTELRNMSLEDIKTFSSSEYSVDDPEEYLPILKVVVSGLPPDITVKSYLSKLPDVLSYDFIRRASPNKDLPSGTGSSTSKIFISFHSEHESFWFKETYDGMQFLDEQGNSYISSVDFAFVQGLSSKNPTWEPDMGILEETAMYKNFLDVYRGDPRTERLKRLNEISKSESTADVTKNRNCTVGYPIQNNTPLSDFLREESKKKAEKQRKIRQEEDFRREQKEGMLKLQQEVEEEARKHTRMGLLKPKHSNSGNQSKPIFPDLWLENKEFRQNFEIVKAVATRSLERIKQIKYSKNITDKLTNEKRAASSRKSSNGRAMQVLPTLPEEDSDTSSGSSDETVIHVSVRGAASCNRKATGIPKSGFT